MGDGSRKWINNLPEPTAWSLLGKNSTTELHAKPLVELLIVCILGFPTHLIYLSSSSIVRGGTQTKGNTCFESLQKIILYSCYKL